MAEVIGPFDLLRYWKQEQNTVNINSICAVPMRAVSFLSIQSPVREEMHKNVWKADQMGKEDMPVCASAHLALDAQLPGNGWPVGGIVEVLQTQPEDHVWRLLLPALGKAVREHAGPVVLINAPREPFGPGLKAHGLPAERLLSIHAEKAPARVWATEQALRCAEVAAVLAWLPQVKSAELRRLHVASSQQERMFFVFRPLHVQAEASPARLRVMVEGNEALKVHILKRRGPPLASPVLLAAQTGRLAELLQARKGRAAPPQVVSPLAPITPTPSLAHVATVPVRNRNAGRIEERSADALDRIALPG